MNPHDPARRGTEVAISTSDYLWFVDLALTEMVGIVRQLGDAEANRRPAMAGANSPFAILTHCLGVMEFWGGFMVAGRAIERDREAEFEATGSVDELIQRAEDARRRLREDVVGLESLTAPPDVLGPEDAGVPYGRTKGAVLLHIVEELFQHLGQMELTRDMLGSSA
jgi:uncharacterized damage-inducible protein DinB